MKDYSEKTFPRKKKTLFPASDFVVRYLALVSRKCRNEIGGNIVRSEYLDFEYSQNVGSSFSFFKDFHIIPQYGHPTVLEVVEVAVI